MRRGLEILTAILVIILVVGALIVASKRGTLDKNTNIFNWSDNREVKEITKEIEKSSELMIFDLDIPNTALEILKGDGDKIKITCSGKSDYDIEQKGSNININKDKYNFSIFNWNSVKEKVVITVPDDVLASYSADMSNGSVIISEILAEDIEIDTSNGTINIYDVKVNSDLEIDTSNGRIEVDKLSGNKITLDSSNGKVNVKNIKGDNIVINTSNGSINAYECYGRKVKLDTSNGSITLENLEDKEFIIDQLDISTSNGKENINANYKNKK